MDFLEDIMEVICKDSSDDDFHWTRMFGLIKKAYSEHEKFCFHLNECEDFKKCHQDLMDQGLVQINGAKDDIVFVLYCSKQNRQKM